MRKFLSADSAEMSSRVAVIAVVVLGIGLWSTTAAAGGDEPPQNICLLQTPLNPDPGPVVEAAEGSVDSSLERANRTVPAMQRSVNEPLDYRQIIDPERSIDGSLSVGTIRDGSLVRPALVPTEEAHIEIIERHRSRDTGYGTRELVEALERAGRRVHSEHGGAPLRIGNLSRRNGGSIPWSSSHEAGRDADLAFYAVDEDGNSVPTPDLVEFDEDGDAVEYDLRFDVERNWTLVRALLTDSDIDIQWLFVSEGLKVLLMEHALALDESPELIERAAKILHQPTDAPPHADHLHLRIACTLADRLEGCVDWGPFWDWHRDHRPALFARTRELTRAFDADDEAIREAAVEFLLGVRAPHAPEVALDDGLRDSSPRVRGVSFEVLAELPIRTDYGIELLSDALRTDLDGNRRSTLYDALARARAPEAAQLALRRYHNRELTVDERALAVDALRHRMDPELVPELLDALRREQSPELRGRIAAILRRITASGHGLDWRRSSLTDEHESALGQWAELHEDPGENRRRILRGFLAAHGVDEWRDLEAIDELIPILQTGADYERYNLNLVLSDWTGRWAPRQWEDGEGPYRFWSNWWERNRDRVLDDTSHPWE